MKICFINPPFKAEFGKFSRESRSPAITKSGALYYPLWLIYAAAYCEKVGYDICFLDAPAKQMNEEQSLDFVKQNAGDAKLFVFGTSTPSIKSDVAFASEIKNLCPSAFMLLVGTHPSARPEETLGYSSAIDAVAIGEYDNIVLELANAIKDGTDIAQVRGLCINGADGCKRTALMPAMKELDEIPFASEFIHKYLDPRDYFFAAATCLAISSPKSSLFFSRPSPMM